MKLVYVSHPFTGNEELNRVTCENIIRKLHKDFPNVVFVNPLDNFIYVPRDIEYCTVLAMCERLLAACDEAIFCKGWENSIGCRSEKAFCDIHNIPYQFYS